MLPKILIPHNRLTLGAVEEQAAVNVIRSGWLAAGRAVESLEDDFCALLGLQKGHAVAVSSGTAALFLALKFLGGDSSTVAFPAYTCASLRHAVAMCQYSERLIDCSPGTPNLHAGATLDCGADLIIVPHMYGIPAEMEGLIGLNVIEDCAQALGAKVGTLPVGLKGKIGVFSLAATKLITSGGQGGLLVSKDRHIVDEIRDYRNFDCRADSQARFNFTMTDLQAAIGIVQLGQLSKFLSRRAVVFDAYKNLGLSLLDSNSPNSFPVRYRAVIQTNQATAVIKHLETKGIRAIVPLEDWELLGDPQNFPEAAKLCRSSVSLPIYPSLTDFELNSILSAISEIL